MVVAPAGPPAGHREDHTTDVDGAAGGHGLEQGRDGDGGHRAGGQRAGGGGQGAAGPDGAGGGAQLAPPTSIVLPPPMAPVQRRRGDRGDGAGADGAGGGTDRPAAVGRGTEVPWAVPLPLSARALTPFVTVAPETMAAEMAWGSTLMTVPPAAAPPAATVKADAPDDDRGPGGQGLGQGRGGDRRHRVLDRGSGGDGRRHQLRRRTAIEVAPALAVLATVNSLAAHVDDAAAGGDGLGQAPWSRWRWPCPAPWRGVDSHGGHQGVDGDAHVTGVGRCRHREGRRRRRR